ncbi:ABC transporter ATP-binding protein [Candidatus Sumerlaeota bacterium]|nr:ABC transporter ATP-binding protein [Candidatus Sumerlaeota bacterium]
MAKSANSDEPLLEARGVTKDYRDADRTLHVLRGIDLTLSRGESVAIVGASGAGKSTLLHLLGGIDRPTQGKVIVEGTDLGRLGDRALAGFRNRTVGFVFQFHHLLAEFSALENVMIPGLIAARESNALRGEAEGLLGALGLEERLTHRPAKLSGGEQQRVALARALINQPALILADEPTGNLDEETGETVIDLLWRHTAGQGRTLLIVTHDREIAARADRQLRLHEGRLSE